MTTVDPDAVEYIPAEAASTYTKLAAAYGQEYYEAVADELVRSLDTGESVVDAGTGPGFLPLELAERTDSLRIDGFDFTRTLLEFGHRRVKERGLLNRVSFYVADCYTIPVPDQSYTALTCTGVLHALEEPVAALTEFHRVLEPTGKAWVFDPAILQVPDDPDVELTPHEQSVLDAYEGKTRTKGITVAEAERFARESPFERTRIVEGEMGDVRLYLGTHS